MVYLTVQNCNYDAESGEEFENKMVKSRKHNFKSNAIHIQLVFIYLNHMFFNIMFYVILKSLNTFESIVYS